MPEHQRPHTVFWPKLIRNAVAAMNHDERIVSDHAERVCDVNYANLGPEFIKQLDQERQSSILAHLQTPEVEQLGDFVDPTILRTWPIDKIKQLARYDEINEQQLTELCMNPGMTLDMIQLYSKRIPSRGWRRLCEWYSDPAELYQHFRRYISFDWLRNSPNLTDAFILRYCRKFRSGRVNAIGLSVGFILLHWNDMTFTRVINNPGITFSIYKQLFPDSDPGHEVLNRSGIRCLEMLADDMDRIYWSDLTYSFSSNPNLQPEFVILNFYAYDEHSFIRYGMAWDVHNIINIAPIDMYEYYPDIFNIRYIIYHREMTRDDYDRYRTLVP